ncbi:uncharacterized protein BKCO1_300093 [Diplodia corticola]|uniref:C2H2-type domain-containing protein n=1 Tax=Diplodia corticola TaxID=236234 RepID=A0A1J9SEQ6_9PEZI|nr:uncharacterized protein BKCO1_300093 [Diplodia corticola]OJD38895.1 hypothetical protein BKCO1_300093 [Diplodia corticola]
MPECTSRPLSSYTRPSIYSRLSADSGYGPSPCSEDSIVALASRTLETQSGCSIVNNRSSPDFLEDGPRCEFTGTATTTSDDESLDDAPSSDGDGATSSGPSSSLGLKMITQWSDGKKKEIVKRVMETFDAIYLCSPGSQYSSGIEEELCPGYDTESDTLSWPQTPVPMVEGSFLAKESGECGDTLQDHDTSDTAGTASRSQASREDSSEKQSPLSNHRKRKTDEHDEDSDDQRKRQQIPGSGPSSQMACGRRFACPYVKRFPNRSPKAPSCVFPGYPNVARLKGHLYRTHMRPLLCLRCYETFRSETELGAHQNAPERCAQVSNVPDIEGITPEQEKQLKSKKRINGDDSEERRWESIYRILFPDETDSPSPYCDLDPQVQYSGMSPGSANLMAYERFSRANLREIVQQRLESQIEREQIIVEERLRSMIFDIMRMAQDDMFDHWRSSLNSREVDNLSEGWTGALMPATTTNQGSMDSDISSFVLLPPSNDHVDAGESLAELPVDSDNPRPVGADFSSSDASSSVSQQEDQPVSDGNSFQTLEHLDLTAVEPTDQTPYGSGYPPIEEALIDFGDYLPLDLDSCAAGGLFSLPWSFNG